MDQKGEQSLFKEIFPHQIESISENLSFINNEEKILLTNLLNRLGLGASQIKSFQSKKV